MHTRTMFLEIVIKRSWIRTTINRKPLDRLLYVFSVYFKSYKLRFPGNVKEQIKEFFITISLSIGY